MLHIDNINNKEENKVRYVVEDFIIDKLLDGMTIEDAYTSEINDCMVTDPMEKLPRFRRRAAEEAQDVKWLLRGEGWGSDNFRIKVNENGKRYVDRKVKRFRQEDDWKFREKRRERHHGKAETRNINLTCDYIGLEEYVRNIVEGEYEAIYVESTRRFVDLYNFWTGIHEKGVEVMVDVFYEDHGEYYEEREFVEFTFNELVKLGFIE